MSILTHSLLPARFYSYTPHLPSQGLTEKGRPETETAAEARRFAAQAVTMQINTGGGGPGPGGPPRGGASGSRGAGTGGRQRRGGVAAQVANARPGAGNASAAADSNGGKAMDAEAEGAPKPLYEYTSFSLLDNVLSGDILTLKGGSRVMNARDTELVMTQSKSDAGVKELSYFEFIEALKHMAEHYYENDEIIGESADPYIHALCLPCDYSRRS